MALNTRLNNTNYLDWNGKVNYSRYPIASNCP